MWPCLSFDEKGIQKTLLGIKIKYISWEEVVEVKVISTTVKWIFISKTPLKNYALTRCRLRRDNVYIVETEEIIKTIKRYAPKNVYYSL